MQCTNLHVSFNCGQNSFYAVKAKTFVLLNYSARFRTSKEMAVLWEEWYHICVVPCWGRGTQLATHFHSANWKWRIVVQRAQWISRQLTHPGKDERGVNLNLAICKGGLVGSNFGGQNSAGTSFLLLRESLNLMCCLLLHSYNKTN